MNHLQVDMKAKHKFVSAARDRLFVNEIVTAETQLTFLIPLAARC
jgi:hypothetical protein